MRVLQDDEPTRLILSGSRQGPPQVVVAELERRLNQQRLSACLLEALVRNSEGRIVRAERGPATVGAQAALNARAHLFALDSNPFLTDAQQNMTLLIRGIVQWLDAAAQTIEPGQHSFLRTALPASQIAGAGETSLSMTPALSPAQVFFGARPPPQPRLFEWLQNDAALLEQEIDRQLGGVALGVLEQLFPDLKDSLRGRHPDGLAVRCPMPRP
jgi:hypothetical protein